MSVDAESFRNCLETDEASVRMKGELGEAETLGLDATPGFAFGWKDANGRVVVKKLILGAHSIEVFEETIGEVLPLLDREA